MANPAFETVNPPYIAFRFEVVIDVAGPPPGISNPVCDAAFAECTGLEMSMEPKDVREGGNNLEHQHRIGQVNYGQIVLRRGMTDNLQLWQWFLAVAKGGHDYSAECRVTLWDADGTPRLTFLLRECLPVRVAGPALNARDGQVAIEEMQLVYKSLELQPASGAGAGLGFSAGVGVSAGFSAGVGVSAGVSATAGLSVSGGAGLSAGGGVSAGFGLG